MIKIKKLVPLNKERSMHKGAVFVDIDLTLTTYCQDKALQAVADKFGDKVSEVLRKSWECFMRVTAGNGSKEDCALAESFNRYIKENIKCTGDSMPEDLFWSREALLAYNFPSMKADEIRAIVSIYWTAIGCNSKLYPDAAAFVGKIRDLDYEVVCVSATDGRLYFDYDNDVWRYDPAVAAELKKNRIALGELMRLVPRSNIISAESFSKSEKYFWGKMAVRFRRFGQNIWMVGDSYGSDICGIKNFRKEARTILLDRDASSLQCPTKFPLADYIVRDLREAAEIIKHNS